MKTTTVRVRIPEQINETLLDVQAAHQAAHGTHISKEQLILLCLASSENQLLRHLLRVFEDIANLKTNQQ